MIHTESLQESPVNFFKSVHVMHMNKGFEDGCDMTLAHIFSHALRSAIWHVHLSDPCCWNNVATLIQRQTDSCLLAFSRSAASEYRVGCSFWQFPKIVGTSKRPVDARPLDP